MFKFINRMFKFNPAPLEVYNGVMDLSVGLWLLIFQRFQDVYPGLPEGSLLTSIMGTVLIITGLLQLIALEKSFDNHKTHWFTMRIYLALFSCLMWFTVATLLGIIDIRLIAVPSYILIGVSELLIYLRLTRPWT